MTRTLFYLFLSSVLISSASSAIPTTTRVSFSSNGIQGNDRSLNPSISADGRYVAFESDASNLVAEDTNGARDIFVRDTLTGTTRLVSVSTSGVQANDDSADPSISADGRYVAFTSDASNLVAGDTNGFADIFVRDTVAGTTRRVSVDSDGIGGYSLSHLPSISADGRYVAFTSWSFNLVAGDTNGEWDVFVRDTLMGMTRRVSVASDGIEGNSGSYFPSISADGRYVAFSSSASNLVAGDTNGARDVFVRDTVAGTTRRVSVASDGTQANNGSGNYGISISAEGRYVAFESWASNLVAGDTNGHEDVFVRDTVVGTTRRVSVSSDGSQGNSWSDTPSISADGRYMAFTSNASNLAPGDTNGSTDVFLHGPLIDDFPFGDVDGDYSFTVADVVMVLRIAGGLDGDDADSVARADTVPDGRVDIRDAVVLLRHLYLQSP